MSLCSLDKCERCVGSVEHNEAGDSDHGDGGHALLVPGGVHQSHHLHQGQGEHCQREQVGKHCKVLSQLFDLSFLRSNIYPSYKREDPFD